MREKLRALGSSLGDVVGSGTTRLDDGAEVAWSVHVGAADQGSATLESETPELVLGASATTSRPLLLRTRKPLGAMEIVRSLAFRSGSALAPGNVVWLEPGDVRVTSFFGRPSAYVVLKPEEIALEAPGVLVVAGLLWNEILLPVAEQRALAAKRGGILPEPLPTTGKALMLAAETMAKALSSLRDERAMHLIGTGLAPLVERGAGPLLLEPLCAALQSSSATQEAREVAAALLVDAGAVEPVIELFIARRASAMVSEAIVMWFIEQFVELDEAARAQLLAATPELGLSAAFELTEGTLADVERAVVAHPAAWSRWALEHLPPRDVTSAEPVRLRAEQRLAAIRSALLERLRGVGTS